MGEVESLTIEILKQIRDGVAQTNVRLDQTREELGARLDQHERILVRLVDEVQVHGLALTKLIQEVQGLNERFDNFLTSAHREDHEDLRTRVAKLEGAVFSRGL